MKLKHSIFYFTGILLLLPLNVTKAQGLTLQDFRDEIFRPNNLPGGETGNVSAETKVSDILQFAIDLILYASGSVAVLMLVYGGIRFITSAGNQEQRDVAIKILRYSITGLVVVIFAFALVSNVIDLLFSATT